MAYKELEVSRAQMQQMNMGAKLTREKEHIQLVIQKV
jgi:hypothetical protein